MIRPPDMRDPEYIRAALPALSFLVERYHETRITGLDELPRGPALVVGNHNGGIMSPDMFALMVAYWRRWGADAPAYGLMHDLPSMIPFVGSAMARFGAVPARPATALDLLRRGAKVLVYPGGDLDAFKPHSRRHEIVFGRRRGFIRVALRAGVPVVPVVSVGAHEAFHVLTDGTNLARLLGTKRLTRVEVLPVTLGLPWGLWVGAMGYLPLPVRMRLHVLGPIAWPDLGPEAADDDEVVWRCREQVRVAMQAAMDSLVAEGGFGRKSLRELLG
ncbi:MAG: 1-acyl-sn-glycerol-3-phosphate acyltransferase [Deltaproteobacteria bacterium]|nr:1-acyl-sn-glycerol-3-phosphate acyltransferase [Deltaproteobacteria bacterium]